jgi:hypothetical protein
MPRSRKENAFETRVAAAEIARDRPSVVHRNNGDEQKHRRAGGGGQDQPSYVAGFTKGLPHDPDTGLLLNPPDFNQFVLGVQSGESEVFRRIPLGPGNPPIYPGCLSAPQITEETTNRDVYWVSQMARNKAGKDGRKGADVRAWESQAAGLIYDLEGPDSHAVTMPPAPRIDSVELAAEMTEDYLMALLRDVHVSQLRDPGLGEPLGVPVQPYCDKCPPIVTVEQALEILVHGEVNDQNWFLLDCCDLTAEERARHRRKPDFQTVFRGITPGETIGPYLSQFLLIGNTAIDVDCPRAVPSTKPPFDIEAGFINYGAVRIDQRVRVATPCKDYMTTVEAWLDVQNAADVRGCNTYVEARLGNREFPGYRVMTTPRDLATYVHFDALYEAYLNACLILFSLNAPLDPGLPFQAPDVCDKQQPFASFGGPHILSLVTEVATRALKAVRYQKFNIHRRLRPEAVGGLVDRYLSGINPNGELDIINNVAKALDGSGLLMYVMDHNECQNNVHPDRQDDASGNQKRYLLPMAFAEGSPMHPAYGAGHATVAGACVTILKAVFDHGHQLRLPNGAPIAFEPNADGSGLVLLNLREPLTVEGELNKLAANISIGRNWAGVHYFSDYIESLRMGEQIALEILREQRLTYGENFAMTVPLFDGSAVRI